MAKPAFEGDNPLASLESTEFGIGQTADGAIASFPAAELPEHLAADASQDEATSYAIEQSEQGFPEEEDPTDISDLDELDGGVA